VAAAPAELPVAAATGEGRGHSADTVTRRHWQQRFDLWPWLVVEVTLDSGDGVEEDGQPASG
jgi:hypothetical protein